MDEVGEVVGLDNACRLCLATEHDCTPIFDLRDSCSVTFAEKIRVCLSIQVTSEDKLPTLVCGPCIKNVNHWHSYKDTCLKAQEKLQQWLCKNNDIIQDNHVETNESRPDDFAHSNDVPALENMADPTPEQPSRISECMDVFTPEVQIKTEPMDTEDEYDCNIDMDSVNSGELLLNPMAVAAAKNANSGMMENDSTEKFGAKKYATKKIKRRGPHTHFRGVKMFKKRCNHCAIYLHSKSTYYLHMSRYHRVNSLNDGNGSSGPAAQPTSQDKQKSKLTQHVSKEGPIKNADNLINPEDLEFAKMIKTDPLTPVQKTIIGQLKTFSCYECKQTFFDRRHTLNHIRLHMPDLKPYTCIACLTEFSDRSMYKLHCSASFECAMKIALVVPKIGYEKYFTCNMCLKAFNNRRELLTHLAMHSDKQHKQLAQPIRSPSKLNSSVVPVASSSLSPIKRPIPAGPYMGGDPAHNHMCDLCGMIYRYKPNMIKHRDLCSTLNETIRTSYRCVHCSMTYLVFKKFYYHIYHEHKKREITCFICLEKFPTTDDFLTHHEVHRVYSGEQNSAGREEQMDQSEDGNYSADPPNASNHLVDAGDQAFNCALCGESFATKHELGEHRNLHLKVKIYSCVVCRNMFSSSSSLEAHMKAHHGLDDTSKQAAHANSSLNESELSASSETGVGLHHCYQCGKNFSNYPNLKRHQRNLHQKVKPKVWSCDFCDQQFDTSEELEKHRWVHSRRSIHMKNSEKVATPPKAPLITSPTGKPPLPCPQCSKTFIYQGNLIQHCHNVHNETRLDQILRHSAPPAPLTTPATPQTPPRPKGGYSCDVCGKSFKEEQSLKTHKGWHLRTNHRLKSDLHMSMDDNLLTSSGTDVVPDSPKPARARKSFPNPPQQQQLNSIAGSLQCQVCDDRFNDVTTLRNHLWDVHCARNKPEKSFTGKLQCELCTTKFSDEASLQEHMQWHSQNPILSNHSPKKTNNDLASGTSAASFTPSRKVFRCETCGKNYSNRKMYNRHKKLHKNVPVTTMINFQSLQKTKSRFCHVCQKNFATDASLRRHKASPCHINLARVQAQAPAKKITTTAIVHQPPIDYTNISSVKEEPGSDYSGSSSTTGQLQAQQATKKKPVTCSVCKTIFPNMSVLYQHKQLVHKQMPFSSIHQPEKSSGQQTKKFVTMPSAEGLVSCNVCGKKFPGLANLKLHYAHKHKPKPATFPCPSPGCKLIFNSNNSLKNHENVHTNIIYNCQLCDRHVFSKIDITKHMLSLHKEVYMQSGVDKSGLWTETDLSKYNVKTFQSTCCPKCKVKYPNLKALKIHYLKFHDKA